MFFGRKSSPGHVAGKLFVSLVLVTGNAIRGTYELVLLA
jgi:hypothetical protein